MEVAFAGAKDPPLTAAELDPPPRPKKKKGKIPLVFVPIEVAFPTNRLKFATLVDRS